jgi:hypothetical protein
VDEIALFSDAGIQITAPKTYDPTRPAEMTFSITSQFWPLRVTHYGAWAQGGTIPNLFDLNDPVTYTAPGEYTLTLTPPSA